MHFPIFLTGGGGIFNLVAAGLLPLIIFLKQETGNLRKRKFGF